MKIKDGFMLREVDGNAIVVATGKASLTFNGMITLNKTGQFLWEQLVGGCSYEDLITAMTTTYQVSSDIAGADIDKFLKKLTESGVVEQ